MSNFILLVCAGKLKVSADELVSHPAFDDHHLRMTKPALCDTAVKQVSGYLDIADDKHLFYW